MPSGVDPTSARFARQRVLEGFGEDAQVRLAAAHVVVIGAGGLGSAVLPTLAAAGVGNITVVDDDAVDASNLARQTLHSDADIGRNKAESAVETLRLLAPDAELTAVTERFTPATAFGLVLEADLLIDAGDTAAGRYAANDAAAIRAIPLVWGNAIGWTGQVGVAWDERGVDYRDLVPEVPGADDASCEVTGVLPTVCTVIGGLMASEAIKLLTGVGEPLLGRAVIYDARSGRMRELEYHREPGVPRPGSLEERTAERDDLVVPQLTAMELSAELARGAKLRLIDVREPWEAEIASIPGSELMPLDSLADHIASLSIDDDLVVYCHHGIRSGKALQVLDQLGFTKARHLTGGIDAWANRVDPDMTRY